jgi:hypothetical protein
MPNIFFTRKQEKKRVRKERGKKEWRKEGQKS